MSDAEEKPNGGTMEDMKKEEDQEAEAEAQGAEKAAEEKGDSKDGAATKKEEEEEEDDEEEESSDEEELPLGSVEAPVQIMTGKRDRKKTERLVMVEAPKTPEKKFEVPVGKGTKLGEIEVIAYQLDKFKIQDLKPLHKFLFGRIIKDHRDTKKNIRLFSGFNFEKDDPEYAKREALLVKFTVEGMKELCTILDVEKKGTKDMMMDRIMAFCSNPTPSGRTVPSKGQKGRPSKKSKPKTPKSSAKKKKKKPKAGGDASTASEDGDTTMEDGTEGDEEEEGDTSVSEKPKKTKSKTKSTPKAKKDTPKAKAKPKKKKISVKTPTKQTKKASPVKSAKKTPQKRKLDEIDDDDSSDDEPLMKKVKAPPTDKELKEKIKEILENANLEQVTMKMVCRNVYDMYPEHPLQHKKDFIKATVREIIS